MIVAHHTSWFMALVLVGWLKLLHLFNFMKWHPTSFLKSTIDDKFARYVLLFLLLYVAIFAVFLLFLNAPAVSPFLAALIIGLLASYGFISWFEGEWLKERKMITQNIPFIVTVLTVVRFIFETATYHRTASKKRKKLPYKASMIK